MENYLFSNFIGPKAENIDTLKKLINKVIDFQADWRKSCYPYDASLYPQESVDTTKLEEELSQFLERSKKNLPYFHPRYIAQMLKDPTIPTILGYLTFMMSNPNNHAYEGGPVTTEMEMEVTDLMMKLVAYNEGWGHLSSGGSLANLEALWAARDTYGTGKVLFSEVSHYSWKRICKILNIPDLKEIPVDKNLRMNLNKLEDELKSGTTLMVIANLGSTGAGSVDDIKGILALRNKYKFHLHIDAAYGGFFRSLIVDSEYNVIPNDSQLNLDPYLYDQLTAMEQADSMTIDPHKHGAVSYGAGAVLYKNMELQKAILNTAPYTYHKSDKPNIGMFSLEGSRPGAMAAATYLNLRVLPPNMEGLGKLIKSSYLSSAFMYDQIQKTTGFANLNKPDLDINCFFSIPHEKDIRELNERSLKIYNLLSVENESPEFILSKFVIPPSVARIVLSDYENTTDQNLTALRTVNIKHWGALDDFRYIRELIEKLENITS